VGRQARCVRLDPSPVARDNPPMGAAELVVLLMIGGACYAALRPLRRTIERWMLRRRGRRTGRVVSLVRNSDDVYTSPTRKTDANEQ
jgi:hypothetical protein